LLVETDTDAGDGYQHHIVGDVVSFDGVYYERESRPRLEAAEDFNREEFIDTLLQPRAPDFWDRVAAPPGQKGVRHSN
jgi:hypothetical protein